MGINQKYKHWIMKPQTSYLNIQKQNKIDVQLDPPHINLINLAERAIHPLKEHFKSLRAARDTKFPKHIW